MYSFALTMLEKNTSPFIVPCRGGEGKERKRGRGVCVCVCVCLQVQCL